MIVEESLGSEDVERIRSIVFDTWMDIYPPMVSTGEDGVRRIFSRWMDQHRISECMRNGLEYRMLVDDNRDVLMYAIRDVGDGTLFLDKLYAAVGERGKGYGTMAMSKILELARSRGYSRLSLHVNARNESAIRFYEGFGLSVAGFTHEDEGGDEYDELSLELVL